MEHNGKRDIQVNVRLSDEEFALVMKAAGILWPGAIVSNSKVLLGLAKKAAQQAVDEKAQKRLK